MKNPLLSLFLCLFALSNGAAHAQSEKRQLTDREDLYGWEAVGRLDVGDESFCTATLIAQDIVLTAAHCAIDRKTGETLQPASQVTFRAGLSNGSALAERKVVQIAAHPDYGKNDPLSPREYQD